MLKASLITIDPVLFVREHNRILREVNRQAAVYHHEKHMPDHFKMVGYTKYGISKRSSKYNKRKQKKYGHVLPNVFTGLTRQLVLSQRKIRATPKGARLEMRAAFRGGSGRIRWRAGMNRKQVDSAMEAIKRVAELEATSQDEIVTLARLRGEWYARGVRLHIQSGGRIRKRARG